MPVKVAISLARGEVKINSRSLPVSPRHFRLHCLPAYERIRRGRLGQPGHKRGAPMRRKWSPAWLIIFGIASAGCGAAGGLPGILPAGDTTPPTVVATIPGKDAALPADAPISATFSKPMNTLSARISAQPQIAFVAGAWSTDERTVTFKPDAPLSSGTRYAMTITARDRSGNAVTYSWQFTAAAPGTPAGAGAARLQGRVEVRPDERIFTLFAAFNASGYDEGVKESGPMREGIRQKLADLPVRIIEPFRKFRAQRPQPLSAYVAYALSLTGPPQFVEQRPAGGFQGLSRILSDFYTGARIAEIWQPASDAQTRVAGLYASSAPAIIGGLLDYARASDIPAKNIVVIPNILDSPGENYLAVQQETAFFVIGTAGAVERPALTMLSARLLLQEVDLKRADMAAEIQRTEPLFELVKDTVKGSGYDRWEQVVRESLVAAVTARLAAVPEQRDQFLRDSYARGLILVDHFAAELQKYERSTVSLVQFVSQMLRSINVEEERRRFAERKQ